MPLFHLLPVRNFKTKKERLLLSPRLRSQELPTVMNLKMLMSLYESGCCWFIPSLILRKLQLLLRHPHVPAMGHNVAPLAPLYCKVQGQVFKGSCPVIHLLHNYIGKTILLVSFACWVTAGILMYLQYFVMAVAFVRIQCTKESWSSQKIANKEHLWVWTKEVPVAFPSGLFLNGVVETNFLWWCNFFSLRDSRAWTWSVNHTLIFIK